MGSGMGWDCSVGVLCDFGNNVHCTATGGLTQGCGAQASLGILYHYGDDSVYDGYGQGYAPSGISYHNLPCCGGNFSFLVDYGSNNTFGCGADTHTLHPARRRRRLPYQPPEARRGRRFRAQKGGRENHRPPGRPKQERNGPTVKRLALCGEFQGEIVHVWLVRVVSAGIAAGRFLLGCRVPRGRRPESPRRKAVAAGRPPGEAAPQERARVPTWPRSATACGKPSIPSINSPSMRARTPFQTSSISARPLAAQRKSAGRGSPSRSSTALPACAGTSLAAAMSRCWSRMGTWRPGSAMATRKFPPNWRPCWRWPTFPPTIRPAPASTSAPWPTWSRTRSSPAGQARISR